MKVTSNLIAFVACFAQGQLGSGFSSSGRVFVGTPVKFPQRFVRDCMTPKPTTLPSSASVDEAIATLLELGVSGAPVLDEVGSFVGIVSTSDFLQMEEGGALLPMEGSAETVEAYVDAAKKIVGRRVSDIMSPTVFTIEPNSTMRSAAALMAKEKLHRLPVVENGVLVGILSRSDVMRDVLSTVRGALPEAVDA